MELQNQMEMTPKQQFLAFVLARGEKFYDIVSDSSKKESDVELAISALIAFVPDANTRAELYSNYFQYREQFNTRTSALVVCGETISALAGSMDIVETASGSFI